MQAVGLFISLHTMPSALFIYSFTAVIHNPSSGVTGKSVLVIFTPIRRSKYMLAACSMVFDHRKPYTAILASSSAWIPLLYATIVFGLTLRKTIPFLRRAQATHIIQHLCEGGSLYYRRAHTRTFQNNAQVLNYLHSVIFSVTLVLTVMIVTAPEGTKGTAAQ